MPVLSELNNSELDIARACIDGAVNGPFFEEWEFQTLMGITRGEMRKVLEGWPHNLTSRDADLAVHNAATNLSGYPHGRDGDLGNYGIDRTAIKRLLDRLSSDAPGR